MAYCWTEPLVLWSLMTTADSLISSLPLLPFCIFPFLFFSNILCNFPSVLVLARSADFEMDLMLSPAMLFLQTPSSGVMCNCVSFVRKKITTNKGYLLKKVPSLYTVLWFVQICSGMICCYFLHISGNFLLTLYHYCSFTYTHYSIDNSCLPCLLGKACSWFLNLYFACLSLQYSPMYIFWFMIVVLKPKYFRYVYLLCYSVFIEFTSNLKYR